VANGCAFLARGADRPPDPYFADTVTTATGGGSTTTLGPGSVMVRRPLEGFGEVAFRVDGMGAALRCALLAETPQQLQRGLMHVTDLGGYDGMIFRFATDTTGGFWMKDTPMPLSIAWFDATGRFVSSADMDPCLGQTTCPTYPPGGPYRYALEVPQGRLPALGIGPGTTVTIGGTCP
jgi:uncharacterized membrane protein (UPF0127 family)